MAAIAAMAATKVTPKQANLAVNANALFTLSASVTLLAGATAGTADMTGFFVPKGTLVLAAVLNSSTDQGDTATFQIGLTTDGTLGTKTALTDAGKSVVQPSPTPKIASADRTVQVILADAACAAGVLTVTLVCCQVEASESTYDTQTT